MTRHLYIPDVQCKPDTPTDHLLWAGRYAAEKKPDVIILAGDFADMESLSSYDVGKKSFEGRTYNADIDASVSAMAYLMQPITQEKFRLKVNKQKQWNPRLVLTLGNHENRIDRAIENDRKLEGLISISDLEYKSFGWEVIPFLEPIIIDGIAYCHYFTSGVMGRPVGSARMLINKKHMSCIAGHQQGRDVAYGVRGDGTPIMSIIAGSFYQHDEGYLNHQTNNHWRGIIMLNEVDNGSFDEMFISMDYLRRTYGT